MLVEQISSILSLRKHKDDPDMQVFNSQHVTSTSSNTATVRQDGRETKAVDLLVSMDGWIRWFFLLLPLCVCADNKETIVKTIRRQPDVTPVCMRENLGLIVFVTCRISTEGHQREECCLLGDKPYDYKCDSRFALIKENQTVYIHLTSLTRVDSGNYSCECSYQRGTHVTHLGITVEEEEDFALSKTKIISILVITLGVASTFIIAAGFVYGHILRNHRRENTRSTQDDLYASPRQPTSDVYQTLSSRHPDDAEADPPDMYAIIRQQTDGKDDFHPIYAIYETV